jgi:hypothetical protein
MAVVREGQVSRNGWDNQQMHKLSNKDILLLLFSFRNQALEHTNSDCEKYHLISETIGNKISYTFDSMTF